jgi:hypothetical protein
MIADITRDQIAALRMDPRRPLVICDVDEVVVHFTRDFENYIAPRGLWLDASSFALNGNIRHANGGASVSAAESAALIERFFADRAMHMQPIDGAIEVASASPDRPRSSCSPICRIRRATTGAGNLAGLGQLSSADHLAKAVRPSGFWRKWSRPRLCLLTTAPASSLPLTACPRAPHSLLHDRRFARHLELSTTSRSPPIAGTRPDPMCSTGRLQKRLEIGIQTSQFS